MHGKQRGAVQLKALSKRLNTALALNLVIGGLVVGLAVRNAREFEDRSRWVDHTREVLSQLGQVLLLDSDASLAVRGQLLTGEEGDLGPYQTARRALPDGLQHLRELTEDNPQQQQNAIAVERSVTEHLGALDRLVALGRDKGLEAARREFALGRADRSLAEIRNIGARMREEEERLLAERQAREREADRRASLTLAGLGVLVLIMLLGAYWSLRRHMAARVRAESALRDSEQNLRVTLQSIGDAVLATDLGGRISRLNPVAERMTGWPEADAAGRPVGDVFRIVNEHTRKPAVIPVEEVLASGQVRGLANHTVLIARDGTEWPIADSAAPIRRADGTVLGVVLVFRDVSEQRGAEAAIRRANEELEQRVRERTVELEAANRRLHGSEQTLRFLIQHAPAAIAMFDRDMRYLAQSDRWLADYGLGDQDLSGRSHYEIFPELPERYKAVHQRCLAGAMEKCDEDVFVRADGAREWLRWEVHPWRDAQDEIGGIIIFSEVITARRRAEEEIRSLNADLERRVEERTAQLAAAGRELAARNLQLDHASRMKSEFLANMSHELRTPLNAVIGFSDILAEGMAGEMSAQQREFASHIRVSGTHLLSLINDILDLSKIEAGSMELELDSFELAPVLQWCIGIVREKAVKRRIDLDAEIDGALSLVEGDSRKTKQIVFNLLSNAIKFTGERGRVRLIARKVDRARLDAEGAAAQRLLAPPGGSNGEFIELAVQDTGAGIAPADLERLFEPFVQVDSSLARRHEGTGLGLALVRRLVELHGGALAVSSEAGYGSRFTVWLPYRTPAAAPAPPEASAASRAAPVALVIEDDDTAAFLLTSELERRGLAVIRASTAEEGLVLARKRRPDLITLDVFLPHIDGWECIERLKSDEQTADIPVVIVSVVSEPERGVALGAVRVLQKPVAREALNAVLEHLGIGRQPLATVLVVDDDPAAVEIVAIHLQAAGMRVLRAYSGKEAIDTALAERPALIVLDIMMPGVSGFDVAAGLKRDAHARSIPIVVVTSRRLSPEERALLNGQVLRVVEKADFSPSDFSAEVSRALSVKAAASGMGAQGAPS